MKIGLGYDIHELILGDFIILGGVKIPYDKCFKAHSDGDVLIHALIDAILGACAKGDIGGHFPDSDEKYKNADSMELLREIKKMYDFEIENIDSNIICEKPKLAPYIDKMRENIALALNISKDVVSIKAKTNEKLEEVGNLRAVKASCIVLLK